MSSNALDSQGMTLKIGDGAETSETFATISEIKSFSGPGGSATVIDTTDLQSTAKEKRMGLQDEGQLSFEINYIPSDTEHAQLRTDRAEQTERNFQLVFTDDPVTTWDFAAFVTGFSVSGGVDDVVNASVTLELTGSITES